MQSPQQPFPNTHEVVPDVRDPGIRKPVKSPIRYSSRMELAAKLQLKPNQPLKAVGTPHSVSSALAELDFVSDNQQEAALLFFITDRAVLESHREQIFEAASRDHLTWVAYPKSGHLGTDLNRDSLAALLSESGVQPVRQVAINEVWSALRFRPGPRRTSPKDGHNAKNEQ